MPAHLGITRVCVFLFVLMYVLLLLLFVLLLLLFLLCCFSDVVSGPTYISVDVFDVDNFTNETEIMSEEFKWLVVNSIYNDDPSGLQQYIEAENLEAINNVFYYEVVQWGDEDVLLSDDDILNSEYFAIYEQEDFSSDNFLSKRNKIIQTQNTKKISESQPDDHLNLSNHIYSTPGVKSIKIIVFRYSKDLTFLLETVLVTKNIVINDGAVLSQDFEI